MFPRLSYFKETENWGDAAAMSPLFLHTLDEYRGFIGVEIQILCGTQGKHAKDSFHYKGEAADIHFVNQGEHTILDLFINALRFSFTGLGIYPKWNAGRGGLHLELDSIATGPKKLWLGIGTNADDTNYVAITQDNLRDAGLIA